MAKIYIEEYGDEMARSRSGYTIPVPSVAAIAARQQVAIGAASAQSQPFTASTRYIAVVADADCQLAFGASPIADGTGLLLVAGAYREFAVPAASKLAVIQKQ